LDGVKLAVEIAFVVTAGWAVSAPCLMDERVLSAVRANIASVFLSVSFLRRFAAVNESDFTS